MNGDCINYTMPAFWFGYLVGAGFVGLLWAISAHKARKGGKA